MGNIIIGLLVMLGIVVFTYIMGQVYNLIRGWGFEPDVGEVLLEGTIGWFYLLLATLLLTLAYFIGVGVTGG